MTREPAVLTKGLKTAWLLAAILIVSEPAAALVSESDAPASAWWAADDLALERGDCARALAIPTDLDVPPAARGFLPDPTGRWEHHARAALLHGECISARKLIERAISDGEAQGYALLGEMHELGRCGPRNLSKAATNYGEAVRRGYVLAAANLGYLVLHGFGVPADTAWARHLFKLVALDLAMLSPYMRRPHPLLVLLHREIPDELEGALQWVRNLEESPPERLFQVAPRLKDGEGMPRHPGLARRRLERASGKGLLEADHTLALWRLAAPERWYEVNSALITLFRCRARALYLPFSRTPSNWPRAVT
jgi:TPR repeat protein